MDTNVLYAMARELLKKLEELDNELENSFDADNNTVILVMNKLSDQFEHRAMTEVAGLKSLNDIAAEVAQFKD